MISLSLASLSSTSTTTRPGVPGQAHTHTVQISPKRLLRVCVCASERQALCNDHTLCGMRGPTRQVTFKPLPLSAATAAAATTPTTTITPIVAGGGVLGGWVVVRKGCIGKVRGGEGRLGFPAIWQNTRAGPWVCFALVPRHLGAFTPLLRMPIKQVGHSSSLSS